MALTPETAATFAVTVAVKPGRGSSPDTVKYSTDPVSGSVGGSVNDLRGSSLQAIAHMAAAIQARVGTLRIAKDSSTLGRMTAMGSGQQDGGVAQLVTVTGAGFSHP